MLQTREKISSVLGEQEASQASLHDINAQLSLWQTALESHRPGKIARINTILEEVTEAKQKLGELQQYLLLFLRQVGLLFHYNGLIFWPVL